MKTITNNIGGYVKERNNCLWYSGELINIQTDYGRYVIFIDGDSDCLLKAKETFVDKEDIEHQKGEILVDTSSKESILDYIKSDDELIKVLVGEDKKLSMEFHNNKSIRIEFFDNDNNLKETKKISSRWVNNAIEEIFKHIKENRNLDHNKYSIYCRCATYNGYGIENQLNICKKTLLSKVKGLDENNINYYIDNGFSSRKVLPPALDLLLEDLETLKEHQIFTPKIDRLSRDIVNIANINNLLVYDDK